MCIFAAPVHRVSNTKLYVAPNEDRTRQLTVYEMKVNLIGTGNAMILPVPGDIESVNLIDMSNYKSFFGDVGLVFNPPTLSMSKGTRSRGLTNDSLAVIGVGSYKVSLAPSIEDLDRLDPEVFTVSEDAKEALRTSHEGRDGGFVVAVLTESGEYHPLAYTHNIEDGNLFVPTRHEHGHGGEDGVASWDHDIYYVGAPAFNEEVGNPRKPRKDINEWAFGRLLRQVTSKVPAMAEYIDPQGSMYHFAFKGTGNNTDLTLTLTPTVTA